MIKIAVIALGKNWYSAFSLNQDYPLATTYRGNLFDSREHIEQILIKRFHSQRMEYKKLGISVPPLIKDGKQQGWKFIWKNISTLWEKPDVPKPETETLVKEPGLTITKQKPAVEDITEPLYIAKKVENGFRFEPVTEDIIPESKVPEYMKTHRD